MQGIRSVLKTAALLACLVPVCAVQASAQEKPGWKPVSKEELAIADAMFKAMMPGEPHRMLASLAGEWDVTAKMWLDPAKPPTVSTGTAVNTMVMDGRYLQGTFKGTMMEMAFEGFSLTGFDNVTGQYQSAWIDSMGTMIMYATGSYDPATKVMTMRTEMSDLMDPKVKVQVREAFTIVDANTHRMEMFETRDGKERKSLELTYTRKK